MIKKMNWILVTDRWLLEGCILVLFSYPFRSVKITFKGI